MVFAFYLHFENLVILPLLPYHISDVSKKTKNDKNDYKDNIMLLFVFEYKYIVDCTVLE